MLVWDNLNVHLRAELRALTDTQAWLRVFWLPPTPPTLTRISAPVLRSSVESVGSEQPGPAVPVGRSGRPWLTSSALAAVLGVLAVVLVAAYVVTASLVRQLTVLNVGRSAPSS